MEENRRGWFAAVSERLRAIVRRRVAERVDDQPDESEAISDLTHETLLAASERLGDFRGTTEAELVAWVGAIADSKLSDHRRSVRRRKRDIRRTLPLDALKDAPPDEATGPEEEALRQEERAWVRRMIELLPVPERRAVWWRYVEQRTVVEVAAELGRSEDAAQALLKRGLVRLRHLAKASGRPDPET